MPLPSAEDHLRRGENHRACAEVARDANALALARDHRDRAVVDYLAALATCAIWPARPDEALRHVEQERDEARAAIRAYVDSTPKLIAERDHARAEVAGVRASLAEQAGLVDDLTATLAMRTGQLARLQVVADAARVFCESEPDSPARTDAYERLFAAVKAAS